jgi:hypothetical protein
MNRLDILYLISAIYTVLGIWGAVEAFFLKIHWGYKIGLIALCIFPSPVGLGLTMYVKYRTRKKKKNPPKNKEDKNKR